MQHLKKISFTLAKNEEDIIESFVRHNIQHLDHMVIADNMSTDATRQILLQLQAEGLPITVWDDKEPAHLQSQKTTAAYHQLAQTHGFDLFFLLDADELLTLQPTSPPLDFQPGDILEATRACYTIAALESDSENVIQSMPRRMQALQTSKAIISFDPEKMPHLRIGEGNHQVYYQDVVQPKRPSPFLIAHFPYRGLNHFLSKVVLGWHAMLRKDPSISTQDKPIGVHWRNHYNYIMRQGGWLSFEDLVRRLYQIDNLNELAKCTLHAPLSINYKNKYAGLRKNYSVLYLLAKAHEGLIDSYHQLNTPKKQTPVDFKEALFKTLNSHFSGSPFFKKIWIYKENTLVLDFSIEGNQLAFDLVFDNTNKKITATVFSRNRPTSLKRLENLYSKNKKGRIVCIDDKQENPSAYIQAVENFLNLLADNKKQKENILEAIDKNQLIPLHWWDEKPNFGDEVGPYLVQAITEKPVFNIYGVEGIPGLMAVGSILHHLDKPNMHVWGAGLIKPDVSKIAKIYKNMPQPTIHAVRGRLTAQALRQDLHWEVPEVFGDPALLLPKFYQPSKKQHLQDRIVLVPHHSHYSAFKALASQNENIFVTNVGNGLLNVIDDIANARCCIATSLHGIIVAQAYGIPWVWLQVTDKLLTGDDFKFEDFFSTLDRSAVAHHTTTVTALAQLDIAAIAATACLPTPKYDLESLLAAFPHHE